jgi:hypothetical protein
VTGQSFVRPPVCEHDGEPLMVAAAEWFVSFGQSKRDPFSQTIVEMARQMGEMLGLATVIRVCPACLCVTLQDGSHSEPQLEKKASH